MNISRIMVVMVLLITCAVCSNKSGWFPAAEAADGASLEIKALVDGSVLAAGSSNQVALPAAVIFISNDPATIYYTTNGTDPTTETTTSSKIAAAGAVSGPTITSADSILVILGEDAAGNLTSVQSYTFAAP